MRYFLVFSLFLFACNANASISEVKQQNISVTGFDLLFNSDVSGQGVVRYGIDEDLADLQVGAGGTQSHSISLTSLSPATVYYVKCGVVVQPGDTVFHEIEPMLTASLSSGDIKVYFNSSVDHSHALVDEAISLGQDFPDTLIAYFDRAQHSIDITTYNIDNQNGLIDALNDAHNRGVHVRLVGHHSMNATNLAMFNIGNENVSLSAEGFAPSGGFYGLMHNKFVVIDAESDEPEEAIVITGSTNFTNDQLKHDPNNIIIFNDQSMAKAFTMEFEEMFNGTYGPEKTVKIPKEFNLNGVRVEAHFSPKSGVEDVLLNYIESFDFAMYFGVFSYTRVPVSEAIAERINDGKFVAGILNQINQTSPEFNILSAAMGNNLIIDDLPWSWHHKYALFDPNCDEGNPMVYTGSANWSNNGNIRSDENIVVVHDLNIANQYYQEFISRFNGNGGVDNSGECIIETGLEEFESRPKRADVRVFPNPTAGVFSIERDSTGPAFIDVIDLQGVNVTSTRMGENQQRISLDLEGYASGIYLLRLHDTRTGEFSVQRLMLQ